MDPIHRALRETQADLEQVSSHLVLIREVIEHGETAPSQEDLARRLAVSFVATLNFEHVAIVFPDQDGQLEIAATYGQTERFGGPREPRRAWATRLAKEVFDQGTVLRWGGDGVGPRRRRPADLEEDAIGLPLETGGEILGAILCTEVSLRPWTLARHRALELVSQSVAQVVALQGTRSATESAKQSLEIQLQTAETKIANQDERIDSLASSLDVADRVKQTFLGLLSHELRTPLAAMLGYASLLREGDAGGLNPDQDGFVERIESNGRRLGYLIEDLLFLTESESTRIHPAQTEVELGTIVEMLRDALPAPENGETPKLEVNIDPRASTLRGDPALIRRLFFHLIDDAWQSARTTVRVEAVPVDQEKVHIAVSSDGDSEGRVHSSRVRLGQSLVRLCASLLDGRSRLGSRPAGEVWIPSASGHGKRQRVKRREATEDARARLRDTKKGSQA